MSVLAIDRAPWASWRRREDLRLHDMASGITFVMYERTGRNLRGEASVNARKVHLDGVASLTLALDQRKYGDELIAQLYTSTPPQVLDRRADGWSRVQIYFGQVSAETAEVLEAIAREIRARVAAKEGRRGI